MQLYLTTAKKWTQDVNKKLKELQQYAQKVSVAYSESDIHKFRVTFKKLRAIVRMANSAGYRCGIPGGLKKLYAAAGVLRDLQIHHASVSAYFTQYNTLPVHYLQHIQDEITDGRRAFHKAYRAFSFSRAYRLIHSNMPAKIHRKELVNWHRENLLAIQEISRGDITDEDIHEIRKYIKNLAYTESYIKSAHDHTRIAEVLGNFVDSCVLLTLLDKYRTHASPDEQDILGYALQHWQAAKTAGRETALNAIADLD